MAHATLMDVNSDAFAQLVHEICINHEIEERLPVLIRGQELAMQMRGLEPLELRLKVAAEVEATIKTMGV